MDWLSVLLLSFLSALVFLSIVFLVGASRKRFDIIDSAWGPTFILIAATNLFVAKEVNWYKLLLFALILIWGGRLAWHIGRRFFNSAVEDRRYTELRSKWPQRFLSLQIYFRIYTLQALLACLVSVPVIAIIHSQDIEPAFVIVGLLIWIIGFAFEAIGDHQLRAFVSQASNKGQLMTTGLWHYSRHPNYFGEITLWWAIGIISLGTAYGVAGLIGPAVISFLILFVSGIPPAERNSSNKPGWELYKSKTSVLLPLPPRK